MMLKSLEVKRRNSSYLTDGQFEIFEDIPMMNIEFNLILKKCDLDREVCSEFGQYAFKDICHEALIEESIISRYFSKLKPHIAGCPVDKGIYNLTGETILKSEFIMSLPIEGCRWKVQLSGNAIDGDKLIRKLFCFSYDLFATKRRIRKNKN